MTTFNYAFIYFCILEVLVLCCIVEHSFIRISCVCDILKYFLSVFMQFSHQQ